LPFYATALGSHLFLGDVSTVKLNQFFNSRYYREINGIKKTVFLLPNTITSLLD